MSDARLLFVSKGIEASSTRYRALQYFPLLKQAGFSCEHASASGGLWPMARMYWKAINAEVVIVVRKTFPAFFRWLLRKFSKRLIFDFDDAVFCRPNGQQSKTRKARFRAMTEMSDHLFAGNGYLAASASSAQSKTTLLPTCVDTVRYQMEVKKPEGSIDLVWIGSQSTSKYLEQILPVLEQAALEIPGLRLKIVADFTLSSDQLEIVAVPWSEEGEVEAIASSHIGIAPMVDDDWTRGKCALKLLQYMAAGLPVISSDAGANREVVVDGESGYLVSSPGQWIEALKKLRDDKMLREAMGAAGQQRVADYFDLQSGAQKMMAVFNRFAEEAG